MKKIFPTLFNARNLILATLFFSFSKAIALEPMRIEVRGHYSESSFEIKKENGAWVCDTKHIQAYPILHNKKLAYDWHDLKKESKRKAQSGCKEPMVIKRYKGQQAEQIVTCASAPSAAKLFGQMKKICQPL